MKKLKCSFLRFLSGQGESQYLEGCEFTKVFSTRSNKRAIMWTTVSRMRRCPRHWTSSSLKKMIWSESLRKIFLDGNRSLKFLVEGERNFSARNGGRDEALPDFTSDFNSLRFTGIAECSAPVEAKEMRGKLHVNILVQMGV